MAADVKPMPGEPILIATLRGTVTEAEILALFQRSLELTEGMDGPIYRITDARDVDTPFSEMILILADVSRGLPGSTTDPRFRTVLVGSGPAFEMGVKSLKQAHYGGLSLPVFNDVPSALVYVREQIKNSGNAQQS